MFSFSQANYCAFTKTKNAFGAVKILSKSLHSCPARNYAKVSRVVSYAGRSKLSIIILLAFNPNKIAFQ